MAAVHSSATGTMLHHAEWAALTDLPLVHTVVEAILGPGYRCYGADDQAGGHVRHLAARGPAALSPGARRTAPAAAASSTRAAGSPAATCHRWTYA